MTEQNFTTQVHFEPAKSNLAKSAISILLAHTQTPLTKTNKKETR